MWSDELCTPTITMDSELQRHSVTLARRRERGWSTSRSSMISQSSTASWQSQKLYEASPAEVVQGDLRAYGSFTTTAPAVLWLRSCLSMPAPPKSRGKQRDMGSINEYDYEHLGSPHLSSRALHRPSISRTSSINSSLGGHSTSASFSYDSPPASPLGHNAPTLHLHPILEAVESASKLSCRTVCVTCLKAGKDFPRCPRCGDMWCSRECRMQGGKRHVCRG